MHQLAGSLALAGTDQRVLLARLLAQADLAGPHESLAPHLMDVLVELEVASFLQGSGALAVADLDGEVLDASELDVAADICFEDAIPRG